MSSNDPFGTNTHNPYSFSDTPQVPLPPDMQRGLVHHVTALSILTIAQGALSVVYGILLAVLAYVIPAFIQGMPIAPVPVAPAPVAEIPDPPIPVAETPAPQIPAPQIPAPQIPAPQIPAPQIPARPIPAGPMPAAPIPAGPMPAAPMPAGPMPAAPMPAGFQWIMMATYGSMSLVSFVTGVVGIWAGTRMLTLKGRTFGIVAVSLGLLSLVGCYCLPTAIGLFAYGLIVLLNPSVKRAFEIGEQGYKANEIQNHFARQPW